MKHDPIAPVASQIEALQKLRVPFAPHQISKLPKPTRRQTEEVRADFKRGVRCTLCGAWHHPDVIHLDYVGHAALTDRLLEVDPLWFWEPLAFTAEGLPAFDQSGGLWIKLHVAGVERLGYGNAKAKPDQDVGAREKEVIGDALRNAAMRFGAALDLWHKGDLHINDDEGRPAETGTVKEISQLVSTATISANTARKNGDWERIEKGLLLQRTPEELRNYINHENQKKIWSAWPQSWKIELRELIEHLKEKLEQEATDRVLDQAFDPRTGELKDEIPF